MIKRAGERAVRVKEAMFGAPGSAVFTDIADADQMMGRARLFSVGTLKPGCGVGYHVHHNECEIYLILKGTAVFNDNGVETTVSAGDVTVTADGQGHSIRNDGSEDVEFVALIPLK